MDLVDIRFHCYWFEIHTFSKNAVGKRKVLFDRWIEDLAERFFCERCREHFIKYIKLNPPRKSPDAFKWTVDFHNEVNKRLGKKTVSLNEAIAEWFDESINNCKSC